EGPYAAMSKLGEGKAAFIGDSSPVEDAPPKYRHEETCKQKNTYDAFTDADNHVLLLDIIHWSPEKKTYESSAIMHIPLDQPTHLLDKDIPEHTTEPEPEPWATPLPTYHWFDPTTFAPGSFGSNEAPMEEPVYSINHEPYLPNDQSFTVQVSAEGLQPGQTVSGFNLGMFLD